MMAAGKGRDGRLEVVWRAEGTAGALRWVEAHGRRGLRALLALMEGGSRRARRLLRHLAARDPERMERELAALIGAEGAAALLERLRVPRELAAPEVLAQLELAAAGEFGEDLWPAPGLLGARLVAARAGSGRDWGLALLTVREPRPGRLEKEAFLFGSRGGPRREEGESLRYRVEARGEEVSLLGAWGGVSFSRAALGVGRKARPGALETAAVRALLRREPDRFWGPAQEWVRALGLDPKGVAPVIVVDLRERRGLRTLTKRGSAGEVHPAEATLFRSLARALAQRDATLVKG